MKIRPILFWFHLIVGITAGTIVLSMSVSGILIAYERQIMEWIEHDIRSVQVPEGNKPLDVETLLSRVQESQPGVELTGLTLFSDPRSAARVSLGREGLLFVNPYTGGIVGKPHKAAHDFFHFMTDWHRWLALEGKGKEVGQALTGAASLCFFLLLLSGLYLWIPRSWSKRHLKPALVVDPQLKGKARDWNWHNVFGIWAAPILLFVTLTGIIMSYKWANNLLFTLTGNEAPPERKREERPPREGTPPAVYVKGLNELWPLAEKQWPGWKSLQLRLSSSPKAPAVFTMDRGDGPRPDLRAQLTLDRSSGEIKKWEPYESQNGGRKLRLWARYLHTGEAGGFLGQTMAAFAALSAAILVWTGFALSWRRLMTFLNRNRENPSPS
jgi:uncharacterized iron-regulated membrane protein